MMKTMLAILLLTLAGMTAPAQDIKTKDGVFIGTLDELVKQCEGGAAKSMKTMEGLEVDTHKYCTCVMQTLMPTLTSQELMDAVSNNKMSELMLSEKNYPIIKGCLENNFNVTKDFRMKPGQQNSTFAREAMIKECVDGLKKLTDTGTEWTEERARTYCSCASEKLLAKGFTMADLEQLKNKNSELFNEMLVPCLNLAMGKSGVPEGEATQIHPRGSDLRGGSDRVKVPLVDFAGKAYKVKIIIGDAVRYFLLDTGASDMMIDRDLERELLLSGKLKKENYRDKRSYQLADGKMVEAQLVVLDDIILGDVHVDNVTIAIIDTGGYLLGKSFLEKFDHWELDPKGKVLTLFK